MGLGHAKVKVYAEENRGENPSDGLACGVPIGSATWHARHPGPTLLQAS